jgi:hypothetical protein
MFYHPPYTSYAKSNLLRDNHTYLPSTLPKPAYLVPYIDPVFGTKITRITGDPGTTISAQGVSSTWADTCICGYNTRPVWDASQTLMFIDTIGGNQVGPNFHSGAILDGNTYVPVAQGPYFGNWIQVVWHPTIPRMMVYVGNANPITFGLYDPMTGIIYPPSYTVPGSYVDAGGRIQGWSADGRMTVINATKSGAEVCFAVDWVNGIKYPDVVYSNFLSGMTTLYPNGSCQISKDGTMILMNGFCPNDPTGATITGGNGDASIVTDLYGNILQQWIGVAPTSPQYGAPSHFESLIDDNGMNVAVGLMKTVVQNVRGIGARDYRSGILRSLANSYGVPGNNNGIIFPIFGSRALPGWVLVDSVASPDDGPLTYPPYFDEAYITKMDGGASNPTSVIRIGQTQGLAENATNLAISSITWAASVATVTTTAPHGWYAGETANITITGAAPAGYNVVNVVGTVTGASTFTVPLVTNPGAETTPGVYSTNTAGLPAGDYSSNQGFMNSSPDGKRFVFSSCWGATNNPMRPVSVYVIDLRGNMDGPSMPAMAAAMGPPAVPTGGADSLNIGLNITVDSVPVGA